MPVRFQLPSFCRGSTSKKVEMLLSVCVCVCVCVCVSPSPLPPRLWHTEFITPLFASYSARMGIAVVARPLGLRNCVKLHNNSGIENMFFPVLLSGFCAGIGLFLFVTVNRNSFLPFFKHCTYNRAIATRDFNA